MSRKLNLGAFIASSTIEDFPESVIKQTKWALMDTLGVGLAGSMGRASQIVGNLVSEFPMKPEEATIWGRGDRASCLWAAFANSVASSCLDADDGHRGALGHPGGVIVPAAIAVAERANASGKLLLEAIIIGYEVGIRAGICMNRNQEQTYYGSGTWGAIGAAAAASRILGLDKEACINALGITEIHAPLALIMGWIRLCKPPEVKEGMGWAALTGLAAAILASKGMVGTFSLQSENGCEDLTNDLGVDFEIGKLYFKPYPACRWAHAPISGVLRAKEEYNISASQVSGIRVRTFSKACHLYTKQPKTIEQAQYSIPFLVGSALVYGCVGPSELDMKKLNDPLVLAVADCVTVEFDAELDAYYPKQTMARIEITTKSGERIEIPPQSHTLGDFQTPLTPEEIREKFWIFAGRALPSDSVERLFETILDIENLENVKELTLHLVH